jgi:Protein of unknown function (DUF2490)
MDVLFVYERMKSRYNFGNLILFQILLTIISVNSVRAQEVDNGLWLNPSFEYKGLKKVDFELSPELRWDEDVTRLRSRQIDFKGRYNMKKDFFAGLSVRVGSIQRNSGWQPRQRIQLNGGKKWKPGDFRIGYTSKIQFSFASKTRARDADFNSNFRNKLSVSYNGIKKFTLGFSFELFHGLSDGEFLELQDWRFVSEGEYKINKRNFVGLGYLIQHKIQPGIDQRDRVVLLSYKFVLG